MSNSESRGARVDTLRSLGFSRVVAGMWRVLDWKMSAGELSDFVDTCLDLGITTFDHADIYGRGEVETLFGHVLSANPGLRERVQIVSKAGIRLAGSAGGVRTKHYDSGAGYLRGAVEGSLKRLKTDYLDLFLIHRPDLLACMDEVAQVAQVLKEEGKIRAFGVSNFSVRQFDLLRTKTAVATNQIEFSPFASAAMQEDMFAVLSQAAVSPMIWSPLGGGRLFSETDPVAARVRTVMQSIQQQCGAHSWLAVAYAWIFRLPGCPYVITGSRREDALRDALEGLQLELQREQWYEILEAARGCAVA
ncbi:aldo/keto reductase [Paraburkholderia sp. Ac-20342]|uniref:aldo/keto reductase n=1 Tax=Paraburkholderia sp. Ac-20342 TaxID=2703889 RepID=UPI00197EF5DF|nr:aldo/keto reductase [Paraburkholderia sp. Ac-20342]MBN3849571.1 aldo/keto reductase [Paraburkholderia sp. Ac-20342]